MNHNKPRVVVAMSGGVDSSVAAGLLKEEGYDVVGVSMQLWDYSDGERFKPGSCCSLDDIQDARGVADKLGIPFYVLNFEDVFYKEVVDYFLKEYLEGKTPNPCLKCNQVVKFELLLEKAIELEAQYLSTGHYARILYDDEKGRYRLLKGLDKDKDQSYFLFTMTQAQLSKTLFPLGGMEKEEVRAHAKRFGLRVAEKNESQEICFVTDGAYPEFISKRKDVVSGEIIDRNGNVLGTHNGIVNYTIGQRKGLGIGGGRPLYVLEIDKELNRIIVGEADDLFSDRLTADDVNWICEHPVYDEPLQVKIRYRHCGVESKVIELEDGRVEVRFHKPEKAVTPGQAVVFYRNDELIGGGWIEK
jgi:tRNA-uridine 2-sulfurtransferase